LRFHLISSLRDVNPYPSCLQANVDGRTVRLLWEVGDFPASPICPPLACTDRCYEERSTTSHQLSALSSQSSFSPATLLLLLSRYVLLEISSSHCRRVDSRMSELLHSFFFLLLLNQYPFFVPVLFAAFLAFLLAVVSLGYIS